MHCWHEYKLAQILWKIIGHNLTKINMCISHSLVVLSVSTYNKKKLLQLCFRICARFFMGAMVVIVRNKQISLNSEQSSYPLTGKWIKYIGVYLQKDCLTSVRMDELNYGRYWVADHYFFFLLGIQLDYFFQPSSYLCVVMWVIWNPLRSQHKDRIRNTRRLLRVSPVNKRQREQV